MKYIPLSLFILLELVSAQSPIASASCSPTLTASYAAPSVAEGYVARLVANNLTAPRGIKFDNRGTLLVVEQGSGIVALDLIDAGEDCLSVSTRKNVINDTDLNHGIELSADGATLYASSSEAVYSWAYDDATSSNTSAPVTLIDNMAGTDHTTRTLLLSKKINGTLLVTRGSTSNVDLEADNITTGHSQVKAFDLLNRTSTYDFDVDGYRLGWGLRNDVGIDEDPITGGVYTVENSVDQMTRYGQDVHENNPGEELNFLGYLNGTIDPDQGMNFGYPECFAAWNVSELPDNAGLQTGNQFGIQLPNGTTVNDTVCAQRVAPRLTFQAHMAPLDVLFNTDGTAAWVTFHGSWDRTNPVGYKLSVIEFANGSPTQPSNSMTAAMDVLTNANNSVCPNGCFRPVGLAWDSSGRLFMSSDSTGEIYVILQANGNSTNNAAGSSLPSQTTNGGATSTGSSPASTTSKSATSKTTTLLSGNALWILLGVFAIFG